MLATDLNIVYKTFSYLSLKERSFLMLIRSFSPGYELHNNDTRLINSVLELNVPSSLYKNATSQIILEEEIDGALLHIYHFPEPEILADWVVSLELILSQLISVENDHNFLIEAYLL